MKSVIRSISVLICLTSYVAAVHVAGASGDDVSRRMASWIVTLFDQRAQPSFLCRGTLISSTFVLSSAQCFYQKESNEFLKPEDVLALFGAYDLSDADEKGRLRVQPKKITIHEEWNPRDADADLALLEFDKGKIILRDDFIRPMYLWHSASEPPTTKGMAIGWVDPGHVTAGNKNLPRMWKVPIQKRECWPSTNQPISRNFCAGLQNRTSNEPETCLGERGGSLIILIKEFPYLKGVKSTCKFSSCVGACDGPTKATVYTDILKFKDWIVNNTRAFNHVHCRYEIATSRNLDVVNFPFCVVDQAVDNEEWILGAEFELDILGFDFQHNERLKFLPRNISQKMPNLMDFRGSNAGLTIIRDFYFKNLTRVIYMDLSHNQIAVIEAGAFNDLVKTAKLWLQSNKLETLDGNLFVTMVDLLEVHLNDNKLKVLSPKIFQIAGGNLEKVNLTSNACIDNSYEANTFHVLEADLLEKCQDY